MGIVIRQQVRRCAAAGLIGFAALSCAAQTVYKCESKGAVVYSHEPCIGARVVDTTPTQGLDKSSGKSRKGADVVKTEQNKAIAEALHPLFGETPAEREKRHRRFKLPSEDRMECYKLDARLPAQQSATRNVDKAAAAKAETNLFEFRKRYRELRC
jgi:hypothetical protein